MKKRFIVLLMLFTSTSLFANTNSLKNKEPVLSKNAPAPIGVYSQAIKTNKFVYISGQIPMDVKTGELVTGDFNAHFKQAMMNVDAIAKAAGGNLNNIVKLTIYLTDLSNFASVNTIMKQYFKEPYPARAVIEIQKLPKNADVEIEAMMEN